MTLLLASLLAAAQGAGHGAPAGPGCSPDHAAAGHCTPAVAPEPAASADPHAGHDMTRQPGDVQELPPPDAFAGPEHAADLFYPRRAMAEAREELRAEHGDLKASRILIDRLEVGFRDGGETYAWDAQFWHGGDIGKLWIKTEGEGGFREDLERGEVQALYSRAVDPWFDLQAGVRYDLEPGPRRGHLVLGVQGLAPYWFEVEAFAFLSNKGELSARLEAEYDVRVTRSLVLQPAAEVDLAAEDVPERGVGSGLSTAELGLRLRYDIYPESGPAAIAPYLGVQYERAFGDTARFARERGDDVGGWRVLLGLRTWF